MAILLIIIGVILIVASILLCIYKEHGYDIYAAIGGGMMLIAGTYEIKNTVTPQAIDVYRGNTTLRITYQDSVAVDTIVVFKNK